MIKVSVCGSVDRAVASNIRDPRFKSTLWQNSILNKLSVNCRKDKKEVGNDQFMDDQGQIVAKQNIWP